MTANNALAIRPEFSPLSLLRSVWKHKLLGCSIAILVTTIGVAVVYRLPAVYKAEALILVDPQKIPERYVTTTVNSDAQDRLATISQEILSSTRLKKIVDDFNLYSELKKKHTIEEVVDKMRKDTDIKLEKGVGGNRPGAFRITYEGPDPVVAAAVVDRITNLYIEENLRSRETQAQGTFDFIDQQLKEAKKELDEQETAMSRYKLQHTGELPQQEASLLALLTQLQAELQGNQDALNRAQQSKGVLENSMSAIESVEASLNTPSGQTRALSLESEITGVPVTPPVAPQKPSRVLQAQLSAALMKYSEEHPDVKRLREQIAIAEREEQQQEAKEPRAGAAERTPRTRVARTGNNDPAPDQFAGERARLRERKATLKAQLTTVQQEIQKRAADNERITRDLASCKQRIEHLPVRELEMSSLTRDYDASKNNYRSLLDKKMSAELATDLEKRQKAETFRVLDRARPPQKPFKPKRELLSALSLLAGIALGIGASIGLELKSGVLLGEWELPAGVVILSRVPHIDPDLATPPGPSEPTEGLASRSSASRPFAVLSSTAFALAAAVASARCFFQRY